MPHEIVQSGVSRFIVDDDQPVVNLGSPIAPDPKINEIVLVTVEESTADQDSTLQLP